MRLILLLIRAYQATLSPDHGLLRLVMRRGVCIYRPTCSEYACQAIEQCGLIKGVALGIKRLSRCHPWREGGYDPV